MISEQQVLAIIEEKLSPSRFEHSLNVARVAEKMAEIYNIDSKTAYLTGLLHDYAKGISGKELLNIAEKEKLIGDKIERFVPDLLHAPVGAHLIEKELSVKDEEILQAIRSHTLGTLKMSTLDKIIFLADMIEPGRDFPGLERLRCLAENDLDQAMLFGLESTIRYCLDRKRILHPLTVEVRNHFLNICKS